MRRLGDRARPSLRRPRPGGDRPGRPGPTLPLLRRRAGRAGALRRGHGRCRLGRGLAGHRRARLLHHDRGLPGGLRRAARRRVDHRVVPMVRATARSGRVHRAVRRAPRADHAPARRLPRGRRRVRRRGRALLVLGLLGSRRAGLHGARRRVARAGRARRGRGELRARCRPRARAPARTGPALAGPGPHRVRGGRGPPAARRATRPRGSVPIAARGGRGAARRRRPGHRPRGGARAGRASPTTSATTR